MKLKILKINIKILTQKKSNKWWGKRNLKEINE